MILSYFGLGLSLCKFSEGLQAILGRRMSLATVSLVAKHLNAVKPSLMPGRSSTDTGCRGWLRRRAGSLRL